MQLIAQELLYTKKDTGKITSNNIAIYSSSFKRKDLIFPLFFVTFFIFYRYIVDNDKKYIL
jgi:hypothetical protein